MSAISELRKLAQDPQMHLLFTFLSDRKDNNKPLPIDRILSATRHKISRPDVVSVAKSLDQMNLANFVAGRRNFPSRILFYYTPASIGKVALGFSEHLERISHATAAASASEFVREAINPHPAHEVAESEETRGFQVQTSALGTLFILPSTATADDKERLIAYIRAMPLRMSA
jgi:hypothetical protein